MCEVRVQIEICQQSSTNKPDVHVIGHAIVTPRGILVSVKRSSDRRLISPRSLYCTHVLLTRSREESQQPEGQGLMIAFTLTHSPSTSVSARDPASLSPRKGLCSSIPLVQGISRAPRLPPRRHEPLRYGVVSRTIMSRVSIVSNPLSREIVSRVSNLVSREMNFREIITEGCRVEGFGFKVCRRV